MNTDFITKSSPIQRILNNKHTSAAAVAYCAAMGLPHVAIGLTHVWAPQHVDQVKQTCLIITDWIKGAAVTYGLVMAGDSSPTHTNTQLTPPETKT